MMIADHQIVMRRWEDPCTYEARCTCGWVADWPHSSRVAADDDGSAHLASLQVPESRVITYSWPAFWLPAL